MTDTAFDRFRLFLPGLWIEHPDRDWAGDLKLLLDSAADQFNEALIAFDLFKPLTAADIQRDQEGVPIHEDTVTTRRRFLYARAFVYALDAARAYVAAVAKLPHLEPATAAACQGFLANFGHIRGVRNSLQHVEERAQAKGVGKVRLGPIIVLGSLNERRFGATTGDGQYVEIDISEEYLLQLREGLSKIFCSVPWIGIGRIPIRRTESDA